MNDDVRILYSLYFVGQYRAVNIENFEKLNIPENPGVYFWKQNGQILYIGKATSLRDRVRSYFSDDLISTRGPRLVDMVFKSDTIEWQETDSVLEALIAEANAIKKHQPHYNVQEKDDKSWNYVVITKDKFPLVLTIRGRTLDVERQKKELKIRATFGPFTSGSALREALKIIRKMFPYIDRASSTKYTSTFYRQIGLAPDTASAEAIAEYKKSIEHIILFFSGKKHTLTRLLEKEMNEYAKAKEFEKAEATKRKLFALDHIQDIALIKEDVQTFAAHAEGQVPNKGFRIEAYDTAHMSGKESAGVMTVVTDGELDKNEYRKFKLSPEIGNNDVKSLREIIERRFKHAEWRTPDLIVIDGGQGQFNVADNVLKTCGVAPMPVLVSVIKDDRHKPSDFLGDKAVIDKYKKDILLANSEAHRFALAYHRKLRRMRNPRRAKL
jgi:excinuclease ABC subunit C